MPPSSWSHRDCLLLVKFNFGNGSELMHAGLVLQQRDGRNLIYRPELARMNELLAYLTTQCCHGMACDTAAAPDCSTC